MKRDLMNSASVFPIEARPAIPKPKPAEPTTIGGGIAKHYTITVTEYMTPTMVTPSLYRALAKSGRYSASEMAVNFKVYPKLPLSL